MIEKDQPLAVEQSFEVNPALGSVSSILLKPAAANTLFLIAHGAGAGMRHGFLESLVLALFQHQIATLRYQFPYMEKGRKFPDRHPVLLETVQAATRFAGSLAPDLMLIAGGKSMGGRMTTLAASQSLLDDTKGLVLIGFPLHPSGKPSLERADHLSDVKLPMLYLQGTRDKLAELELMSQVDKKLGRKAEFCWIESADHMFNVLKKTGRTQDEVLEEMAAAIAAWASHLRKRS